MTRQKIGICFGEHFVIFYGIEKSTFLILLDFQLFILNC